MMHQAIEMLTSIFRPQPFSARAKIAGLRDQVIELGTHVRFLEADRPVPQPRDAAGRFISKRELMRQKMADACSKLTDKQREAAKSRGLMRMQGRGE